MIIINNIIYLNYNNSIIKVIYLYIIICFINIIYILKNMKNLIYNFI